MLPIFVVGGLLFLGPPYGEYGSVFTYWFAIAVVYAGFFFLLGPTKPKL